MHNSPISHRIGTTANEEIFITRTAATSSPDPTWCRIVHATTHYDTGMPVLQDDLRRPHPVLLGCVPAPATVHNHLPAVRGDVHGNTPLLLGILPQRGDEGRHLHPVWWGDPADFQQDLRDVTDAGLFLGLLEGGPEDSMPGVRWTSSGSCRRRGAAGEVLLAQVQDPTGEQGSIGGPEEARSLMKLTPRPTKAEIEQWRWAIRGDPDPAPRDLWVANRRAMKETMDGWLDRERNDGDRSDG